MNSSWPPRPAIWPLMISVTPIWSAIPLYLSNMALPWLKVLVTLLRFSVRPFGSPGMPNLDMVPSGSIPLTWLKILKPSWAASTIRFKMFGPDSFFGTGYIFSQSQLAKAFSELLEKVVPMVTIAACDLASALWISSSISLMLFSYSLSFSSPHARANLVDHLSQTLHLPFGMFLVTNLILSAPYL